MGPAKLWLAGGLLAAAAAAVPVYVNWLRHRPHRLTQGTLPIWWGGVLAQLALAIAAWLVLWLG